MKKASLVLAIAFGVVFLAQSQTSGGQAKKSQFSAKQLGDVVGSVLNAGDKSCAGEKEIHP
jgi:hypothetical protein